MTEHKRKMREIMLFPNYFKAIGWAVFALAVAGVILMIAFAAEIKASFAADFIVANKWNIFAAMSIGGLFMVGWARDKVEDEMTIKIRYMAMSMGLYFGVAMAFLAYFKAMFSDYDVDSGHGMWKIAMAGLSLYLVMYKVLKRRYFKAEKEESEE